MRLKQIFILTLAGAVLGALACSSSQEGAVRSWDRANRTNLSLNIRPAAPHERKWHPASFRGLEIGKAKANDFVSLLGAPMAQVDDRDRPKEIAWLHFNVAEPFNGRLDLTVEKQGKLVRSAVLAPENLSFERVKDYFKLEPQIKKYSFVDCEGSESAPIVESGDGELVYYLFPEIVIAISVDDDSNRVRFMEYLQHPPGSTKAGWEEG